MLMPRVKHGWIEKEIALQIERARKRSPPRPVQVVSRGLIRDLFGPAAFQPFLPTPAQRNTVARAMRSFVRKHPQYALTSGQGRRELYLYDATDAESVMWAKMNATRKRRGTYSVIEMQAAMRESASASTPDAGAVFGRDAR